MSKRVTLYIILFISSVFIVSIWFNYKLFKNKAAEVVKPSSEFSFVAWGDTKLGLRTLTKLSQQVNLISPAPVFTIYAGDLQGDGFDIENINIWTKALNGDENNGIFSKTFLVRGNHDNIKNNSQVEWQNFFNFRQIVDNIKATNFSFLPNQEDLTYSFDYLNSHFVGIDIIGDNILFTTDQAAWVDKDIKSAEERGIVHTIIFFHGPLYYVDDHPSQSSSNLIYIINNHPSIKLLFSAHEHVMAYTHLDFLRIPSLTKSIEQFVVGTAGSGFYQCNMERSDYCDVLNGFALIKIKDNTVNVIFYKQDSNEIIKSWEFN